MATKKRENWIKEIIELENKNPGILGEIDPEELNNFTVGQLKALLVDMNNEIAEKENKENLPAITEGAEEGTEESEGTTDGSKFITMCGSEFNPKKSGECFKQCQIDFPEAFQACIDHYKITDLRPASSKAKSTIGKTPWGHLKSAQGGKIDDFFFEKNVGSLKEICEFSGGKEARVMHHMKHLVFDVGIEILYAHRAVESEKDGVKTTSQEKIYWWAEADKRRKGDKLIGKSAYASK